MDTKAVLRKADTIVFSSAETGLMSFLGDHYEVKDAKEDKGSVSALFYSEELTIDDARNSPYSMLWSKNPVTFETKGFLPEKTIISGSDIKDEFIRLFMSSCSV